MKHVATLCILMSLFYPNTSSAEKLKKIPPFCSSILDSLARRDITRLAALETHFDQLATIHYDPMNLARGIYPLLDNFDFSLFLNLSLEAKAYLLTDYTEYFSITQLKRISEEPWFKRAQTEGMKKAVSRQIDLFEEMAVGGDYFDEAIKKKYKKEFRVEDPDFSDGMTLSQLFPDQGHSAIYNFIQGDKGKTHSIYNAIAEEIGYFKISDLNRRHRALTPFLKQEYARELVPQIEVNNSYFEFLLLHYRNKLSPVQFYRLVEIYQTHKRSILKSTLPLRASAESWNFYGEILRAAGIYNIGDQERKNLLNFFSPDILAMSHSQPENYESLLKKIWDYGNSEISNDRTGNF